MRFGLFKSLNKNFFTTKTKKNLYGFLPLSQRNKCPYRQV